MARTLLGRRKYLVDPQSASSEPFRTLRLAIDLRPDARTGKAIVFTSPGPGDGKSTVAANYALVAAAQSRVLLIDADLRGPRLHDFFQVPRSPGIVELLRDGGELDDVRHSFPAFGDLELLTAGSSIQRTGGLIASQPMVRLLEEARRNYDLVVIDSQPILAGADAPALASHHGTDVVVVLRASARRRPLMKALRELHLIEANVLGLVLNREGRLATPYPY